MSNISQIHFIQFKIFALQDKLASSEDACFSRVMTT